MALANHERVQENLRIVTDVFHLPVFNSIGTTLGVRISSGFLLGCRTTALATPSKMPFNPSLGAQMSSSMSMISSTCNVPPVLSPCLENRRPRCICFVIYRWRLFCFSSPERSRRPSLEEAWWRESGEF